MHNGDNEMAALVTAIDGDVEFELLLGELVGKHLRKRERAIRDMEAARLLPSGWRVVAERFNVSKATVYNMRLRASQSRKIAAG